jgi:uncharacterized membrane protein
MNAASTSRAASTTRAASTSRVLTIWLWAAVTLSLLAWAFVGYPWLLCVVAVVVRGRRYTYAWATLFAIPYLAFAVTELLVNPRARWVAGVSLLLVFAWFCTMILFLRASRAHRE